MSLAQSYKLGDHKQRWYNPSDGWNITTPDVHLVNPPPAHSATNVAWSNNWPTTTDSKIIKKKEHAPVAPQQQPSSIQPTEQPQQTFFTVSSGQRHQSWDSFVVTPTTQQLKKGKGINNQKNLQKPSRVPLAGFVNVNETANPWVPQQQPAKHPKIGKLPVKHHSVPNLLTSQSALHLPQEHHHHQEQQSSLHDENKSSAGGADIEEELTHQNLYKTELCRSWQETGSCRYGSKCQFAHGMEELRPVLRHPKYKTEICRTFHTLGTCPYGTRCRFIHNRDPILPGQRLSGSPPSPSTIEWMQQQQQQQQQSTPPSPVMMVQLPAGSISPPSILSSPAAGVQPPQQELSFTSNLLGVGTILDPSISSLTQPFQHVNLFPADASERELAHKDKKKSRRKSGSRLPFFQKLTVDKDKKQKDH